MPNSFIDELARLNSQNFLGGLTQAGEAIKEQRQNEAVANLYNTFNAKREGLQTTDQQLSEFNKTTDIAGELGADKVNNVIDSISKATLNLDKIYQQKDAYQNLYSPFITAFATLGDEGVKIANTLSKELNDKKDLIMDKAEIPMKEMEYKASLSNFTNNIYNIEKNKLQLDELKKTINENDQLKTLTAQILQDPDGQQLYRWGTGVESIGTILRDDPKVKETNDRLYAKYSSNPMFQQALTLISGSKNFYRRSVLMPSSTGTGAPKDDDIFVQAFTSLQDDSKLWDSVHSSNDYPYTAVREILFGTKDGKGNPVPPSNTEGIKDDVVKGIVMDYVNAFMKSGEKSYNKRFQMASTIARKYNKSLGFDFVLPQYGLSGKDILYFDERTGKPIYEPYLYHQGYYKKQSISVSNTKQNMFAPNAQSDATKIPYIGLQ